MAMLHKLQTFLDHPCQDEADRRELRKLLSRYQQAGGNKLSDRELQELEAQL